MKTLVCVFVLVMGCGGAIAETPTHGGGGGGGWHVLSPDKHTSILDESERRWRTCESLMEKAMRAMDEFVVNGSDVLSVYIPPAAKLRSEADRVERHDKALDVWAKAKAQCWSNY